MKRAALPVSMSVLAAVATAPGVLAQSGETEAPRLVVVVVVDQLRADYLDRFGAHFGEGGFRLLLDEGASFPAARYAHASTSTCPGHAVVLSGSHADVNGIIGNDWYDPEARSEVYCSYDPSSPVVGGEGEGRSPRNLIGNTVGDVLKSTHAGRSRVISVSGKDRSAIMLGGHLADGVYWMQDTSFVSSSYYGDELPEWVRRFNGEGRVSAYVGTTWERLLPEDAYLHLGPDDAVGEADEGGMGLVFPHPIGTEGGAVDESFIDAFEHSPLQNEVLLDFAMRAVDEAALGQDDAPDILAIGLSSNDRVGHAFGPDSHEAMDVTVRTDRGLARLFEFLDTRVGLDRTLVVLTADHGVAPLPERIAEVAPSDVFYRVHPSVLEDPVGEALEAEYGIPPQGEPWVLYHSDPFVYLNAHAFEARGISVAEAERVTADALSEIDVVHAAYTRTELIAMRAGGAQLPVALSFHPDRSGSVYYVARPNVLIDDDSAGTGHGSPWTYDTQVPLLLYGPGVRPGTYHQAASVADIAPTLARLLGIVEPSGSIGRVLGEALEATTGREPRTRAQPQR
jgi:predicted AlkP superfamily pyrophosphatase or phosphodiesterase